MVTGKFYRCIEIVDDVGNPNKLGRAVNVMVDQLYESCLELKDTCIVQSIGIPETFGSFEQHAASRILG